MGTIYNEQHVSAHHGKSTLFGVHQGKLFRPRSPGQSELGLSFETTIVEKQYFNVNLIKSIGLSQ